MSLLDDMLKALDRWQEWKRMREAPGRIDELERRLAALEAKPTGETCPYCNEPGMKPRGHPMVKGAIVTQVFGCSACGKNRTVVKRI